MKRVTQILNFHVILFLCCILLIALREPRLLIYPRLWAEEGVVFYEFARHNSLLNVFTTSHVGYLTLFNSIVSSLQAKIFSVEAAATVSTYFAFLIQLVPVYIIIFTTHPFWNSPFKKIICVIIVIIVTPAELWLNTTNSHFIFGLITFFIMVTSTTALSSIQKYFFRLLLFIGGLTGPASIFCTPIFVLKAYKDKTKEKYIQASISAICSIIQASIIIDSILFHNTYQRLTSQHNFKATLYGFFVDNFSMIPPVSSSVYKYAGNNLYVFFFWSLFMSIVFAFTFIKNRKKSDYLFFYMSFIIISIFSTLGSLNMTGSSRYAYIPTCLLMIILALETLEIKFNNKNKKQYIASAVFIFCLMMNVISYVQGHSSYSPSFPKWKDEVAKWRADSTYNPRVHPLYFERRVKL